MDQPPHRGSLSSADHAMAVTLRWMARAPPRREWSFEGLPDISQLQIHQADRTGSAQTVAAPQETTPLLPIRRRRRPGSERPPSPNLYSQNHPDRSPSSRNFTEPSPRARRPPMPNPFGTREEIESENYESPLEGMFTRAWNRYSAAEQVRRSNPIILNPELEWDTSEQTGLDGQTNEIHGLTDYANGNRGNQHGTQARNHVTSQEESNLLQAIAVAQGTAVGHYEQITEHDSASWQAPPRVNPIDEQTSRPAAKSSEDLTVSIACQVCHEQRVDTLLEPCMHISICRWCCDILRQQARRVRHGHAQTRGWNCPICRRKVVTVRRVFLS